MTDLGISRRLGSRWCCAWQVGLVLVVIGLSFSAGWTARSGWGAFLRSTGLELLADAAAAGLLGLAALTAFRTRSHRTQPVLSVVALWVAIAFVRGLLLTAWQPEDSARIANSNVTIPIWALLIVYLFATHDEVRARAEALETANEALRGVQGDTRQLLTEQRRRLVEVVQVVIAGEIAELRRLVATLAQSTQRAEIAALADRLSAYSSEVVRETSHQLRSTEDVRGGQSRDSQVGAVSKQRILTAYLRARQPVVIPTVMIMTKGISVSVLRWDAATLVSQLAAFGAMFVVAMAGRLAIERIVRRPSVAEFALSTALVLATALVVMRGFDIARGADPDPGLVPVPTIGLYVVLVFIAARVIAGVNLRWRALSTELEVANAQLEAANDRLYQDLARTRQQLADVLHGPVQGRLAAASMALRLYADGLRDGRDVDYARTLATTVTLLDRAIGDLDGLGRSQSPRWPSIAEGIEQLAQTWSGLVAITWHVDDACSRSGEFVDGVVDLASELVTNASRHGDARSMVIEVRGADPASVEVMAVDDGRGPGTDVRAGVGLASVERFDGSWELSRTPDGHTRVRLVLRDAAGLSIAP